MLVQHIKVFLLLDVDVVEDIFVNMDKNLIKVIDEDQLNVIINLDEVILLQNVHWTLPIDEINVQQNLLFEIFIGNLVFFFYVLP
jgi:hypothetical protein